MELCSLKVSDINQSPVWLITETHLWALTVNKSNLMETSLEMETASDFTRKWQKKTRDSIHSANESVINTRDD